MNTQEWLRRAGWLATVAGVLTTGRLLHAQQGDLPAPESKAAPQAPAASTAPAEPSEPTAPTPPAPPHRPRYWLGLGCVTVDADRRAELKLDSQHGLEVGDVVPESPAAKSGLKPGEVVLEAGGKPMGEVAQLIQAVEAAEGKPLSLLVWNAGQTRTVEVTPAERPAPRRRLGAAERPGRGPRPEMFDRFLEHLPGAEQWGQFFGGPEGHRAFMWRFGPGVVLGGEAFPDDLHVKIEKHGNQPAQVEVQRGDQKWELSEENLDKLPEDIRPHLERMLGRSPLLMGHWNEEIEENVRRGFEDRARHGAEWARQRAERAREDADRMAREYGDRAHAEAERAADEFGQRAREWEHALRRRLERMRPPHAPDHHPPAPPHDAPPRPDQPHPDAPHPGSPPPGAGPGGPDPLAGLDRLIDEQIRRRVEKPLADLQRRLDDLLQRLPKGDDDAGDEPKNDDDTDTPGPRI